MNQAVQFVIVLGSIAVLVGGRAATRCWVVRPNPPITTALVHCGEVVPADALLVQRPLPAVSGTDVVLHFA